jgi:hypothetical protein
LIRRRQRALRQLERQRELQQRVPQLPALLVLPQPERLVQLVHQPAAEKEELGRH